MATAATFADWAKGDLESARKYYQIEVEIGGDDDDTNLDLGEVLLELGDLEEAEKKFRAVIKKTPDNPAGFFCMGELAEKRKDLNAADVQSDGVDILRVDLAEDPLQDALKDVEIIYHLAAQPGISATTPFETYERNNIIATNPPTCSDGGSVIIFTNSSKPTIYDRNKFPIKNERAKKIICFEPFLKILESVQGAKSSRL